MEYHRLDLVEQKIESLEGLAERSQEHFLLINLQRNKLTNFEHFGTHSYLSELLLQRNKIESFRGLTKQASLRLLCLQGCPVAAHPYYRLMALLTIGLSIEAIDGLPITSQERHIAKSLGKRAALAVSHGWLLDLRPRTVDEYDALINDCKRLRKDEYRQTHGLRRISIDSVLMDLNSGQLSRSYDATVDRQLEERQRTITRLARRVAQLEGQLSDSAEGHVVPMLPPNQLEVTSFNGTFSTSGGLFSAAELAQVDTVCFLRGVQMRHNFSTTKGGLQRVCLQLDHATLTAQAFLARETLVQMPLRTLRVRHLRPLTLVVEDEVGGALGLVFENLPLLHTVYKALFVLSARPIPPLSALTQRQLQEIAHAAERRPKAAAAITFPVAAEAEASPSRASSPDEKQPSGVREAAVASDGSTSQRPTQNLASSPASVKLDNVEDVPPLPAAFSHLSATGGTDSVVFSVDGVRPSTAEDAAQSTSNIVFHSVALPNAESNEVSADAAKPVEIAKTASSQKSKLFANLMVNSSASSDSVVFQTNDAKSDAEGSITVAKAKVQEVPPSTTAAAHPMVPPSKAPLAPRPAVAVPPRPPRRKSQVSAPAISSAALTTQRNAAGPPPLPTAPPRPLSTRSTEKSSLNSSTVRGGKSHRGLGESSIAFHVTDAAEEKQKKEMGGAANDTKTDAVSATPIAAAEVARPRIPSRFGALQIDSDSDSN
ncbi:hypothetical protein ABB37_04147 [Leptomonas pyrrhocoris]|uniref:Leucine-rich repeat protein n=1 Tax=Leptomonas pyrrhocoris TaxID=157538 RepID=A0A0N0VFR1_LEPPY|nr:hypothetical protein ABB37_04147 [Leptomonas pyrrhocoris]KPA81904.1 hypothetical protein ABB37_04147 [Leptomonas pyrrhocoris]|eukprot:XP_015660343.1 hypothetical protein ABB37_04147 [Leptomonas pyrrhocoris]